MYGQVMCCGTDLEEYYSPKNKCSRLSVTLNLVFSGDNVLKLSVNGSHDGRTGYTTV